MITYLLYQPILNSRNFNESNYLCYIIIFMDLTTNYILLFLEGFVLNFF